MKLAPGTVVRTTQGSSRIGIVLARFPLRSEWTDGTYRQPYLHEIVVPIEWRDGTRGWAHRAHLAPLVSV